MRSLAVEVKRNLPMPVLQVLGSDEWKGGQLLQVEGDVSRPTSEELVVNFCWLKPVVQRFAATVPSAYFCTDLFLCLDALFLGKLLHPTLTESKKQLAAQEGNRLKGLIGALRFLWRSSSLMKFMQNASVPTFSFSYFSLKRHIIYTYICLFYIYI